MLDECERIRKALSGDDSSEFKCYNLLDDQDFETTVTLQQFSEWIYAERERLKHFLDEALNQFELNDEGLNSTDIDCIELVGDCSRTPIFQEIIK